MLFNYENVLFINIEKNYKDLLSIVYKKFNKKKKYLNIGITEVVNENVDWSEIINSRYF